MIEDHLETSALDWLDGIGYECCKGEAITGEGKDRERYREVVLRPRLASAVRALNPDLAEVDEVVDKLADYSAQSQLEGNREVHDWLISGVPVEVMRDNGEREVIRAQVIDFEDAEANDWLAVQQFTAHGTHPRRPDVVVFVNGLPLIVMELKNPGDEDADIEEAWKQIQTYKREVPQLFHYNLLNVISDGIVTRYGSLTADLERHTPWRLIGAEEAPSHMMELEVLCRGLLDKATLLRFLRGYVAFVTDDGAAQAKVVAQWQQFHGVEKAVERAVSAYRSGDGKGGVVWHTQGSGKSFLALFYAHALRKTPELENPSIVVVTDRNDLDGQLFETFAACRDTLETVPVQFEDRADLRKRLQAVAAGGIFFTTINKFAPVEDGVEALSQRRNIIVIADEAHRTQYGFRAKINAETGKKKYGLAKYMREALPNAIYLGMTGTPVEQDDRDTRGVFGEYVDVYDMLDAQRDGAVVPISYEARIIDLAFNEAEKQALLDEFEEAMADEDVEGQSKAASRYTRLEALATAEGRMQTLAEDLVKHWEQRQESIQGKAMVVAISRAAAVQLYDEIVKLRPDWYSDDLDKGKIKVVMTGSKASDPEHFAPHRTDKTQRKFIEKRFKKPDDELEIVIVRDMWLTGTDSPPCHTMYIDKPMHGHGLMQAIARVNRVWKDKPGGLVVDYIGIGEDLKKAITSYTSASGKEEEPVDRSGKALGVLLDTLDVLRKEFWRGFDYSGFEEPQKAVALLKPAMDHIAQINPKGDEKGRNLGIRDFIDQVTKLTKAQAIAGTREEALAVRDEIAFFQVIKAGLVKMTRASSGKSRLEKEAALRQLVAKGVLVEGVRDLYEGLGIDKPDISLVDESFIAKLREMPQKNLAAELLQRLLDDKIKSRGSRNAALEVEFAKKLKDAIDKYRSRSLHSAEVIEELIQIAKELAEHKPPEGLTEEEAAFYQALIKNESAVRELGDPTLRALAQELTDKLRKSATINWHERQSARAGMRAMVKVLLKRYRYPPDKQEAATETVLSQAERLADTWAFELS
ncbi:type I restriction endonuclease subunit R [Salinisphaera sp. P385]|uniref:Type I restriction enzyme endonuclease subunit n=1 Tax=Spectribacter acetivorans TaxID=3075603 RepID=A0ABU3B775_9GAMM|nr:type I restriction endonuclease subunit R [Salinisphaera sp. P385]MDT0618311.1 type I restriction endonuclease subunit R [Salinisphaera sp. P385]